MTQAAARVAALPRTLTVWFAVPRCGAPLPPPWPVVARCDYPSASPLRHGANETVQNCREERPCAVAELWQPADETGDSRCPASAFRPSGAALLRARKKSTTAVSREAVPGTPTADLNFGPTPPRTTRVAWRAGTLRVRLMPVRPRAVPLPVPLLQWSERPEDHIRGRVSRLSVARGRAVVCFVLVGPRFEPYRRCGVGAP